MTVSGSVFSFVPHSGSGGGNNDAVLSLPPAPVPLTIAGHTMISNPSGVVIDGSTLLPGGSPFTISNTPISLETSGILVFGSSNISLQPQPAFAIGTNTVTTDPTVFPINNAKTYPGGSAQTINQIVNSLGPSGASAIGSDAFTPPTSSVFVVAGQTITPNSAAFSIAGTTISAGGPAATVDGTVVSLGTSGALAIGSSTYSVPISTPALFANSAIIIAGQTVTPNPSAFPIGGTSISAGGPGVTINGTVVSLHPSGILAIGLSTLALSLPLSSIYYTDGLNVQAGSSNAVVDGVTLTPGASGASINGTVVSLESGGKTLGIGTGRFAMPTGSANATAGGNFFNGGQERCSEVWLGLLLVAGAIVTLLT